MSVNAIDTQVGGNHYKKFKIQPVEYIHANGLDFMQGNVVKYITRHKFKKGKEDIQKAIHFCQLILELEYGETKSNSATVGVITPEVMGQMLKSSAIGGQHLTDIIKHYKGQQESS